MSWASRRRFVYVGGVFLVLALLLFGIGYLLFYDAPSCFDGKQNGEETGVDCGGVCRKVCTFEAAVPQILWSRFFEMTPNRFSVVGLIENPNVGLEAHDIPYVFELRDASGALVATRRGSVYLPVDERQVPVFESNIEATGTPRTVFLSLGEDITWRRSVLERPRLVVYDAKLESPDVSPKLTATLENDSLTPAEDVSVVALLTDIQENVVAASRTVVPYLDADDRAPLVFTWPSKLREVLVACPVPVSVVLLFDVSGSMNDISSEPPQPLSDAKGAAASFVSALTEKDRVGLVTFATNAERVAPLTTMHQTVATAIQNLAITPADEQGGTNIGDALREGVAVLGEPMTGVRRALVLLTDGMTNLPGEDPKVYAEGQGAEAETKEISVYTIGLGDNVDETFLKGIASNESQYYHASEGSELLSVYTSVSKDICERSAVVQVKLFPIAGPPEE